MSEAFKLEPWSAGSGDTAPPMSGDIGSSQSALLEAIARGTRLAELLHGIVHWVERHADGVLCSLLVYEPASGTLRHAAARRLPRELCALVDGVQVGPSSSACALAAHRREPVLVTDIATHPAWVAHRDPFLAQGVRASWSSPILSPRGALLGALGTYFAESRGPTESERGWLDAAVHLASIALASAQAEHEKEQLARAVDARTRELNLLHESVRLLQAQGGPLGARLEALLELVPRAWSRPEQCQVRIRADALELRTPGFDERALSSQTAAGERRVSVDVVQLGEPPAEVPPVEASTLLGSLAALIGGCLDKHRAENALQAAMGELREQRQRLELHVGRLPIGLVVWDRERNVTQWSPAAERLFGWPAAEVLGKRSSQLEIVPAPEREADALGRELVASDANGARGTHEHVHRDGARLVCDWLHAPLQDQQGRSSGYFSMVHDVSERIRAEEERARLRAAQQQAQRLQALGTLAGGVAHDFNNILTAITGHAHLGLSDIEEERSPIESLQAIQEASVRAVELVRRILMFGRPPEPERAPCSIGPIVEEVLASFRASTPHGISFESRVDPSTPLAFADALHIRQALTNMVANSVRAVGEHGRVSVEVDAIASDHEELIGSADKPSSRFVRIALSDTGVGMDEQTRERVFEPFFSTKPSGQGTGLGLSVVHGIVKSHDGVISVRSEPGHGSVFRVYLPEAAAPEVVTQTPSPSYPPSMGAHVMYVDDEEPLVALATRWLGRLGYKVSGFSDAREALEAFRREPLAFDALISDVAMPELSGLDLMREVLAIRRDMVVVMSSGYLTPEDRQHALDAGALDVVLKPQSMAELGRILHRILSERSDKLSG